MRYISLEQRKHELLLVARVLLMVLFVYFGWQKLTGFSGTVAYMTSTGAPAPTLSAIIAVVMEFGVGVAIVVGFYTRPARAAACALYPWHGIDRPSLLDHDGHGAVREYDQFLQEHQHHRRPASSERDRSREILDRQEIAV